jgi:hypothetical protein
MLQISLDYALGALITEREDALRRQSHSSIVRVISIGIPWPFFGSQKRHVKIPCKVDIMQPHNREPVSSIRASSLMLFDQYSSIYVRTIVTMPINTKPIPA